MSSELGEHSYPKEDVTWFAPTGDVEGEIVPIEEVQNPKPKDLIEELKLKNEDMDQ